MEAEHATLEKNKTWTIVDLPPNHNSIGYKCWTKVREAEHATLEKNKT